MGRHQKIDLIEGWNSFPSLYKPEIDSSYDWVYQFARKDAWLAPFIYMHNYSSLLAGFQQGTTMARYIS